MVQLQIQVKGDRNVAGPSEISVDGLEIHSTGQMQSFEMRNFNMTSSITFTYMIVPLRTGRFVIPPQTLRAGGNSLRTPELILNVTDSPGQSPGSNRAGDPADPRKNTFAELIVPKTTAYVGEMIPVVVRVGFELQTRVRTIRRRLTCLGKASPSRRCAPPRVDKRSGGRLTPSGPIRRPSLPSAQERSKSGRLKYQPSSWSRSRIGIVLSRKTR